MKVTGTFEVKLNPAEFYAEGVDGVQLGRLTLDKTFSGPLSGNSQGEMLSARSPLAGSAGYVAIEQVNGTLQGKKGSFVLQHFGTMQQGSNQLKVQVVPDSGAGELAGLAGEMAIRIEDGKHYYDFDFAFNSL